jgi:hypothetical protein
MAHTRLDSENDGEPQPGRDGYGLTRDEGSLGGWVQWVTATSAASFSDGFIKPRVLRGLSFISRAI